MDIDPTEPMPNPGLIEKLTVILEGAKRGEVVGFAAVTFMRTGAIDHWGFLTRREDFARVGEALDDLKQLHQEERSSENERSPKGL